jgi:glutathione S-transferase
MIGAGLETDGARGFHPRLAGFLTRRYGFSQPALAEAYRRVPLLLRLLEVSLGDGPWFFGERFTALDLYSATSVNLLDPPPHEVCPMIEPLRRAFESMRGEFSAVPASLLAHRARVYATQMELPIEL